MSSKKENNGVITTEELSEPIWLSDWKWEPFESWLPKSCLEPSGKFRNGSQIENGSHLRAGSRGAAWSHLGNSEMAPKLKMGAIPEPFFWRRVNDININFCWFRDRNLLSNFRIKRLIIKFWLPTKSHTREFCLFDTDRCNNIKVFRVLYLVYNFLPNKKI